MYGSRSLMKSMVAFTTAALSNPCLTALRAPEDAIPPIRASSLIYTVSIIQVEISESFCVPSTAVRMSLSAFAYFSVLSGSAAAHSINAASSSSALSITPSLRKAIFIPFHFFQPLDEPEYLLAYWIFTLGSACISSIIRF